MIAKHLGPSFGEIFEIRTLRNFLLRNRLHNRRRLLCPAGKPTTVGSRRGDAWDEFFKGFPERRHPHLCRTLGARAVTPFVVAAVVPRYVDKCKKNMEHKIVDSNTLRFNDCVKVR